MTVRLSSIQALLTQGLLILFLLVPFQFQLVKLLLIFIILGISIATKQIYVSKKCFLWNLAFVGFNGVYLLLACIRNNPGMTHYIATYICWPILFMLFSGTIKHETIPNYIKTIKFCVVVTILTGIALFLFFNITLQSDAVLLNYSVGLRPGFPFLAINSPIITDFIFWFFFFFTLIFVQKNRIGIRKVLFIVSGIVFIFATSRRILFLNFAISIVFIALGIKLVYDSKSVVKKRIVRSVVVISLFVFSAISSLIACDLMEPTSMTDFFNKTAEASDEHRMRQAKALIDGWIKNPLFGAGPGIDASVSRSNIPGTYELTYLAKLFEVGFIGMIIYIGLWGLLFYWIYRTIKSVGINHNYVLALLNAMLTFMIANATNPYLNAFDYMWFMYTPFVAINIADRNKRRYVQS